MLNKGSKKKLVELADSLDSKGLKKEADELDGIIRESSFTFSNWEEAKEYAEGYAPLEKWLTDIKRS